MKLIPLHGKNGAGRYALVDDEDFNLANSYKWRMHSDGYAVHTTSRKLGKQRTIYLHRLIMKANKGEFVDHKDTHPLHCYRSNLRVCSKSQNGMNRQATVGNAYGLKGVSRSRSKHGYRATITVHGKSIHLGCFATKEEAHAAYVAAAPEYHGEFANW